MTDMITIDGSQGEGGGQILRTALGLSLVTGRPFEIERIRAGRRKPGLLRQHLTAVRAACAVSRGQVEGDELGSRSLRFIPGEVRGGDYQLAVGTAGSATLVLQTILPALVTAPTPSRLVLEGGTHNPFAPPFDFLAQSFLPILRRMGPSVDVRLERHGFFPAGGGRFTAEITPCERLEPLDLLERGDVRVSARAVVARLPEHVGRRELEIVRERLGLEPTCCRAEEASSSAGPGNVVMVVIASEPVVEVVTSFGEKGRRAEDVADEVCTEAEAYLAAEVPVGRHLADQLLIPMAMAGGGSLRTVTPTAHTRTNAEVIALFLDVDTQIVAEGLAHRVDVVADGSGGDVA